MAKRNRDDDVPVTTKDKRLPRVSGKTPKSRKVAPREHWNDVEIACLHGGKYRFLYTGQCLDQADRDVFELLIYLCKHHPLNTTCSFSSNNFLKLIDRPTSQANYLWLEEAFTRLLKATILIYKINDDGSEEKFFGGHLVDWLEKDTKTKKWSVRLGPELYALYTGGAQFTYYSIKHRLALKKHPLASWLQGFFCTHAKPIPFSVEALMTYSRSESKSPRSFKQQITKACEKLHKLGIFLSWGWQGTGANARLFVVPCLNKHQNAWLAKQAPAVDK